MAHLIDIKVRRLSAAVAHARRVEQVARFLTWRAELANFLNVSGLGCELSHVPEDQWLGYCAADATVSDAAIAEHQRIAG